MSRLNITDCRASAYVDASAGSGKTKLLIDRIVRMLLSGIQPSKILCITFTNAAADEMSERLRLKLLSFLTMSSHELEQELYTLNGEMPSKNLLNYARNLFAKFVCDSPNIQTLHGFCSKILQKMHIIQLHDNVVLESTKILNDDERNDLLHKSFNDAIGSVQNEFRSLAKKYETNYIFDLICDFWNTLSSFHSEEFMSLFISDLPLENTLSILKSRVYDFCGISEDLSESYLINEYIELCDLSLLQECCEILNSAENITSKNAATYIQRFLNDLDETSLNEYISVLLTGDLQPRTRLPLNAAMCKEFPHIQEFLLKEQTRLCELIEKRHSIAAAKTSFALNAVAFAVLRNFHMQKKSQNLFEYSDLIRHTQNLIQNSDDKMALLYSIDMMIDHILVDEAQDLSEVQWFMIHTITSEFFAGCGASGKHRTIFIVGDFKQAIFGFQGSAPKIFQAVKEFYRNSVSAVGQKWYEVQLETCYRCAPEILSVVDKVCNAVQSSFSTSDEIQHISIHEHGHGLVQIHELQQDESQQESSTPSWRFGGNEVIERDHQLQIAEQIANTIHEWFVNDRRIGKSQTIIQPQDIMILLRKRSAIQDHLVHALNSFGIPISNLAAKVFGNNIVIYDLLSILQFAIQPLDDMNLVALLKSPVIGMQDSELLQICNGRNGSVWEVIQNQFPILHEILKKSRECDLQTFVQWCIQSVYKIYHNEVVRFMEYVFTYCKITHPVRVSLQGFIVWVHDLLGQKQQRVFDNKSVRITTVHSAKGLEAPVVILADAAISNTLFTTRFVFEGSMMMLNSKNRAVQNLINEHNDNLSMESMRLLYVAMTRPKNELHVFGMPSSKNSWYSLIRNHI